MRIAPAVVALMLVGCGPTAPMCPGCVDSGGVCQAGIAVDACGTGGKACVACTGSDRCGMGACGKCGKANCSGCCAADGRCIVEMRDRDMACGFDGAACVDCTAVGKTCSTATLGCS